MSQSTVTRATQAPANTATATTGVRARPECARLATIIGRFTLFSTDGAVERIRLSCPGGRHHITLFTEGHRS